MSQYKKYFVEFPIPIRAFESFLPHRAPAIWIDEVLRVDATSGSCGVRYSKKAPYAQENSILESAYLEWMAQSFGYICAAQYRLELIKNEGEVQDAFLAAVRNYQVLEIPKQINEGEVFEVAMKATHRVGPVTMVEGTIIKDGKILATANLKLFAVPKN